MLPGAQGLQIEFSLASKSQPLPLDPLDWIPNVVSQISQIYPDIMVAQFAKTWRWHTLATCSRSRSCGRHFARGSPSPSEALSLLTAAVKASVSGCLDTVEIHQSSRNAGKMAGRLEDGRKYPEVYLWKFMTFSLRVTENMHPCLSFWHNLWTCGPGGSQRKLSTSLLQFTVSAKVWKQTNPRRPTDMGRSLTNYGISMGFPWDFHGISHGISMGFPMGFLWPSHPWQGSIDPQPLVTAAARATGADWPHVLLALGERCQLQKLEAWQKSSEIHRNPLKSIEVMWLVGPSGT